MLCTLRNSIVLLRRGTLAWGIFIILSASFMRQLYNFILLHSTRDALITVLWIAAAIVMLMLFVSVLRVKDWLFCLHVLPILICSVLLLGSMEIIEERIHVLKYSLLGFLIARDLRSLRFVQHILCAFLIGSSFGIIDELFQWILPYRVGDPRDVLTNMISVALGIWAARLFEVSKQGASIQRFNA